MGYCGKTVKMKAAGRTTERTGSQLGKNDAFTRVKIWVRGYAIDNYISDVKQLK